MRKKSKAEGIMILDFKPHYRDFPGGPVLETPCFHCRGHGSIPGQGTKVPHAARPKKDKNKNKKNTLRRMKSCLEDLMLSEISQTEKDKYC